MEAKLNQLKTLLGEVADLGQIIALLDWDQQTYMPQGAAETRGQQLSTLSALAHEKGISPEIGKLLEELAPWAESLDRDSEEYRLITVTAKDYAKETLVPTDYVAEYSQVSTMAHQAWAEARAKSDFSLFRPHLERMLDLKKRYVSFFPPAAHPYDTLLDDFEPGMKTDDVKEIFNTLRPQQVELIQAIAARPQVDDAFMHLAYDEQKQWDFGVNVVTAFGYDWNRGRQDKSAHPFTTNFGIDDVRITTRFEKDSGASALFSTMHEAGHGMYEQGVGHIWARTPLAGGASLAVHESQSRMWENLVGRSLPFWEHFYPKLQAAFPAQLGNVGLEQYYKGINKVERSLVRVESDEATYNLHIMLRLELEIAMIEGALQVKDLPEAWNAKMRDYLGLTPPNDAKGVLQDIHWSGGMIGYFSTYALGNLISAQLWEKFRSINPDLDDQMRKGDFSALLSWLRVKIHQHGRKYEPQELVQRVTGSKIDPAPYVRYLKTKYGQIYGL
ncbi:MAG: carboxypeptidase [Anaerolineae bacterium CG_4_9_14_3_um_filter_57_17]|nr:carboxypeptidase M32 [bacterium]NCT20025.1 carboxypeptidase M32 [bacterium]OIO86263.1 MAG: carboxypeptidase [Anaerolineae bacterium CG2_30_57_67]PJB66025.1 MAG: carboxypeptidase [Anaerolineae bacterium CG_4_9_14_3_um_filter_57_17]